MLLKKKSKNLAKNLFTTLQVEIDPLVNKLSIQIAKDLSSLVYPMYLSPPSSCYQWTSWSLVFTSFLDPAIPPNCIRQASPPSFGKSLNLSKLQNTLYTLKMCGLYLSTNLLSRYENGRGNEKKLQWFLTKEWVALSLKR